jgi:hypothetical protein
VLVVERDVCEIAFGHEKAVDRLRICIVGRRFDTAVVQEMRRGGDFYSGCPSMRKTSSN